jgi:GMP reductase
MRIENDPKLDYSDVLIRPKRSTLGSRKEVDLERRFAFRNYEAAFEHNNWENYHYQGIPIMASNMDGVGTMAVAKKLASLGLFTCLVKTYSEEQLVDFFDDGPDYLTDYVAVSIGISDRDLIHFEAVYDRLQTDIKYVCIDVANGYSERFVDFVRDFRNEFPHVVIIAGNVVTGEMTEELILNGADIVKVGIGPGSVCSTRIVTGVGYPQLSAVIECADAAHGLGGHIIADGGCTSSGDVAKAFAAGADFVMLGGMLSGTSEGGGMQKTRYFRTGEVDADGNDILEEKTQIEFYGMSSKTANNKHFGGLKDYRSSEGRTVLVDFKGNIQSVIQSILGGVRSACTYAGAEKLKNLPKCATFVRCSDTHTRVFESKTIGN